MSTTAEKLQKLMQTKDDIKTAINDPALGDRFADYPVAITEGKAYIAQKITEKGVAASRNDTFQQLGDKVGEIQSGEKWIKLEPISTFAPDVPNDYKQLFIPVNEDVKGIILRVDYSNDVNVFYNQLYVYPVSKPFSYGFINGAEIGYLNYPFSNTNEYNLSSVTTTILDNQFIFYCADIGDTLKNLWYMYIK